jgi:hypothetical protein
MYINLSFIWSASFCYHGDNSLSSISHSLLSSRRGKNVNEVCDILGRMTGTLTMLVVPVPVPGADSTLRNKAPILHLKVRERLDGKGELVSRKWIPVHFGIGSF